MPGQKAIALVACQLKLSKGLYKCVLGHFRKHSCCTYFNVHVHVGAFCLVDLQHCHHQRARSLKPCLSACVTSTHSPSGPLEVMGEVAGYTSRWKLILADYSNAQARLNNSQHLLEETSLALYSVNKTTLRQWYVQKCQLNTLY